ncbi:MAG: NAD(P)-dependent oxidoreductase [Deltaproteobacteria bacterium]|nr:NAD(P)-dependent oxidoreductase [Deltaproteobacteria bacterium]
MTIRCGFIGLGKMGKAIAGNLAPKGFPTVVFDVVEEPIRDLEKGGAKAAAGPSEVGAGADVIGICVPADSHVRDVLLGEDGVLANAASGSVICIHSTIHPDTIEEMSVAAKAYGIDVLDVPVAGGPERVEESDAYFMVGGDESAFEKARPYLEASAGKITYCGELGNASKLKLAINLHTNISFASALEAARLTRAMGLPQELFEEAGETIGTLDTMLLRYLALQKQPPEVIQSEAMQAHLLRSMGLGQKDVSLALEMARENHLFLPVAGLVSQLIARIYSVDEDNLRS